MNKPSAAVPAAVEPVKITEVFTDDDFAAYISDVPKELKEHLASQDKDCFFAHAGSLSAAQQAAWRRTPVLFDDLPESLKPKMRAYFERPETSGGLLKRGDAILFEVPVAAREHYRGVIAKRIADQMDASDRTAEDLDEEFRRKAAEGGLRGDPHISARRMSRGTAKDQAIGGREIMEKFGVKAPR